MVAAGIGGKKLDIWDVTREINLMTMISSHGFSFINLGPLETLSRCTWKLEPNQVVGSPAEKRLETYWSRSTVAAQLIFLLQRLDSLARHLAFHIIVFSNYLVSIIKSLS